MKELKVGDEVTLNGIEGKVIEIDSLSFISSPYMWEDVLFGGDPQRGMDFSREILGYSEGGDFPECRSLADLTKLVRALKEREKSAEECVTEEVKTANIITKKLYTWKKDMLKSMWANHSRKSVETLDNLFHRESNIGERLTKLDIFDAFTEEVVDITIGGMEYYIRKSEVNGLNLITNE